MRLLPLPARRLASSHRSRAEEGVATTVARTIMEGIAKSQRMLVESEAQYMAIRGGMSDDERDVASPPASPGLSRHIPVACVSIPAARQSEMQTYAQAPLRRAPCSHAQRENALRARNVNPASLIPRHEHSAFSARRAG